MPDPCPLNPCRIRQLAMFTHSPPCRAAAFPIWVLLLSVWFCVACNSGQMIIPPRDSSSEVDIQAKLGCKAESMSAQVNSNWVRLRAGPNLESKILMLLLQDEVYPVFSLNTDETWVQLNVYGSLQEAWVFLELTDFSCTSDVPSGQIQTQANLFLQKLEELKEEPESEGDIPFSLQLYIPENEETDTPNCDVPCAIIRDSQQGDGSWFLRYENHFTSDQSNLSVVHLIPLAELHSSGAWGWMPEWQIRYGLGALERDPGVRVLVSRQLEEARGSDDPGTWLPETKLGRCAYALDWIRQKSLWQLSVDTQEKDALAKALATCD